MYAQVLFSHLNMALNSEESLQTVQARKEHTERKKSVMNIHCFSGFVTIN